MSHKRLLALPNEDLEELRVSDLTLSELRALIRETVQTSVAEVLIEFSAAAEMDEQVAYEAEMNELLRAGLHNKGHLPDDLPQHRGWDD